MYQYSIHLSYLEMNIPTLRCILIIITTLMMAHNKKGFDTVELVYKKWHFV